MAIYITLVKELAVMKRSFTFEEVRLWYLKLSKRLLWHLLV